MDYSCEDIDYKGTEKGMLSKKNTGLRKNLCLFWWEKLSHQIGCSKENNIKGETENAGQWYLKTGIAKQAEACGGKAGYHLSNSKSGISFSLLGCY